jgi:hypothetical protein
MVAAAMKTEETTLTNISSSVQKKSGTKRDILLELRKLGYKGTNY